MKNYKSRLKFFGMPILYLLVYMLYFFPTYALLISEINFDPQGSDDGREWIEIYNDTNKSIDLTTYKFFEEGTNHGITTLTSDKNILAGEYVVLIQDINKFKNDSSAYSGKIFKASFSLSNTGEVLSIKDSGGTIVATVNYLQSTTGAKDGDTINFDGTNYSRGISSPGAANILNTNTTSSSTTTNNSTTTATSTQTTTSADVSTSTIIVPTYYYRSYFPESEKVYTYAGENKTGITGGKVIFSATCVNGDKKTLSDAHFFWSFGDGATAEGKDVSHTYKYPGEYTTNLECYAQGQKREDQIYVLVFDPEIKISLNNDGKENYIQINNNGNTQVDLGEFLVITNGGEFTLTSTLPKKFSILGKRNVKVPQDILNYATNTNIVSLHYANGKQIDEFRLATSFATSTSVNTTVSVSTTSEKIASFTIVEKVPKKLNKKVSWNKYTPKTIAQVIKKDDIPASNNTAFVINDKEDNSNNSFFTKWFNFFAN